MIVIEPYNKLGIFPGKSDTVEQWMYVIHNEACIANLPIPINWQWSHMEKWASAQIDLYLKQQNGQVHV